MPFTVLFQSYILSQTERELRKIDVEDLEPDQQLTFSPGFHTLYYGLQILILLCVTTFLKAFWKRPRPEPPGPDHRAHRSYDMRSKETNCSMPSGDAA